MPLGNGNLCAWPVMLRGVQGRVKSQKPRLIPGSTPIDSGLANTEQPMLLGVDQAAVHDGLNRSAAARLRQQLKAKTRDERKVKRTQFAKDRISRPRFPGQSLLEQEAVSDRVAVHYQNRYMEFQRFSRIQKMSLRGLVNLDKAFVSFLNHMFLEGESVGEASKTMAAVLDCHPECGRKTALLRSKRCLQGWHRLDPQQTRPPLPLPLVALIIQVMLERKQLFEAASVMLMFVAYLRPWELQGIGRVDLVMPNRLCRHHGINLHPSSRDEVSKMGLRDESILLDSRAMPYLGKCLQHTLGMHQHEMLLPVDPKVLRLAWEGALMKVGLNRSHAVLHQLRHSGPSYDKLVNARTMLEIKMRGRWAADSSVKRYENHAWVGQEFQSLPKKIQRLALAAEDALPKLVHKSFSLK